MTIDFKFELKGWQEVNRALELLPRRTARKVLRKGVAAGGYLMRKELKSAAPKRTSKEPKRTSKGEIRKPGHLRKKIGMRYLSRKSKWNEVHYGVGPRGQAFYGYFVEAGHAIVRGRRQKRTRRRELRRKIGGVSATTFGFVQPHPYIIPTFRAMVKPVINRVKEKLEEGIFKEGEKLGFKKVYGWYFGQ